MVFNYGKKLSVALSLTVLLSGAPTHITYAAIGWNQEGEKWFYDNGSGYAENEWIQDTSGYYFVGKEGYLLSGWQFLDNNWYFLNPVHDGTFGKRLVDRWEWIDGYCYFFNLEGQMLSGMATPDGFQVGETGAWILDGQYQKIEGKGIITNPASPERVLPKSQSSGGGTGGGKGDQISPPSLVNPPEKVKEYSYTIRYADWKDKSVLHVVTGSEPADTIVAINPADIPGFKICDDQKDYFQLNSDAMEIWVYYTADEAASPSDAIQVSWKVSFVDQDNYNKQILKPQTGNSKEGTQLAVDFPEVLIGVDGYLYESAIPSPYLIQLFGSGLQKYYVEFMKRELIPDKDPDEEAKKKLESWILAAKEMDRAILKSDTSDYQIITDTLKDSNSRMIHLVSAVHDSLRYELYIIARNHIPTSLMIGQEFPDIVSISELVRDEFVIGEDTYTVMRIGFEKRFEEKDCMHNLTTVDFVDNSCISNGKETLECLTCGYDLSVILPAPGHQDQDQDGECDVCYQAAGGESESNHYRIGDVQARRIGEKVYLFRCIDDDYQDSMDNHQTTALFLCDTIIRSDIDSNSQQHVTLDFGIDNNYKNSDIRKWLDRNGSNHLFSVFNTYTGIQSAYSGATGQKTYEQFDDYDLTSHKLPFQLQQDKLFLLSVEEAVKYRDFLWKFQGSEVNNAKTQYSAFSKGYWLRTPQYEEDPNGDFKYGNGIYIVDTVDGSIHSIPVWDSTIGFRPAMTLVQG